MDHSSMLGIGSRDTIHSGQFTNSIGRDQNSWNAFNAGIAISCICCIQLITGSKPTGLWKLEQFIEKADYDVSA